MRRLAEEYLCTVSLITPSCKHVQVKPDSLNSLATRVVQNSVCLLGQALFLPELKFESNHQILKSALSKQTDLRGNIESMYDAHCDDWLRRVYENWLIYNNEISCDT